MVNGRTDAEDMAARHAARNGEPPLVVEMLENVMNGTFDGINEHGCRMALNEINRLRAAEPRWIPVTERLPKPFVSVIAWRPGWDAAREASRTDHGRWLLASECWRCEELEHPDGYITHWMPLPAPPGAD